MNLELLEGPSPAGFDCVLCSY